MAERKPDNNTGPVDSSKIEEGNLIKQEALVMLEGELADALEDLDQANNQINSLLEDKKQLTDQLANNKVKSSSEDQIKIELLESKLEESLRTLADLENNRNVRDASGNEVSGEAIQKLETDLAKSEATISELQEKLSQEKLEREKLFNDFRKAGEQISKLESSLNEPLVESQSKPKPIDGNFVVSPDVADLEEEIRNKNSNLSDLKKQLDMAIEELALKESELEILQAAKPQASNDLTTDSEEITMLNQEIASLKDSLAKAKTDAAQTKPDPSEISSMQEQLQNAVADGLELQAELEETRKRMQGMEQQLASSNAGQYDQLIKQARDAEQAAFTKIQGLTAALRRSEELRKETENLLELAQQQKPASADITSDPRYQELEIEISSLKQELSNKPTANPNQELAKQEELKDLQEEMRLLQQDLLNARNLEDPMVADLQRKLELSREDAQKLNIEFKNAMEEFGKIKDQVTSLENENARLR
ncbi:MAG: hypothetical protein EBS13_00290, partial [Verrucomicrobia bacterium]|nr:hypothetical protein [Verrucomicrobiota bacterium]